MLGVLRYAKAPWGVVLAATLVAGLSLSTFLWVAGRDLFWPWMHLSAIAALDTLPSESRVHLSGVVTYSSPDSDRLFLQDASGAIVVERPANGPPLSVGEQIDVAATLVRQGSAISLRHATIGRRRRGILPPAVPARLAALATRAPVRVGVTGVVQEAIQERDRLLVTLVADSLEVPVTIAGHWPGAPDRLLDATVTVYGVGEVRREESSQVSQVQIWAAKPQDVIVLEPARVPIPLVSNRQFLVGLPEVKVGHRVRIRGRMRLQGPGKPLLLDDGVAVVPVWLDHPMAVKSGDWVEAMGFPLLQVELLTPMLQHATVIAVPEAEGAALASGMGRKDTPKTIAQIRALDAATAAQGIPVTVRGVVTFPPIFRWIFVQDATAGIFVDIAGQQSSLEVGDEVVVRGLTGPGDFAPVIVSPMVERSGRGALPSPWRVSIDEAEAGIADSQFVELEGIVHPPAKSADGSPYFRLSTLGKKVFIRAAPSEVAQMDKYVDARVRLRGVLGTIFNKRRQISGFSLFWPSTKFMEVIEPGTPDSSHVNSEPIAEIMRFASAASGAPTKIQATVTMRRSNGELYVQDDTGKRQDRRQRYGATPGQNRGHWLPRSWSQLSRTGRRRSAPAWLQSSRCFPTDHE